MKSFIAAPTPYFEQFSAARLYQITLGLSPNGEWVAYSVNTSGQFNLWVQSTQSGCPRQLTFFEDETVRAVSWAPDGQTIAFQADKNGNERHQIYLLPVRGGWPTLITHTPDASHYLGGWSRDGQWLAYTTNDRDRAQMDIVLYQLATGETQRFITHKLCFFVGFAPNGQSLLALEMHSNLDNDIYLLEAGQAPRLLTAHSGNATHFPIRWAPDGHGFYCLTNEGQDFSGLAFYEVTQAAWHWVEKPAWDVEGAALSKDGQRLAWVINEDGYSHLYVRDLNTGGLLDLPPLPQGVIFLPTLSDDGHYLACSLSRPTQATELFVIDLAKRTAHQLTDNLLGGLDPADLVEPTLVRFASFDQRLIPGFLYRPRVGTEKMPVLLSVHGGPEQQERPRHMYAGFYQYLLSRGIGIFAPNIRGSSGYGRTYQQLIYRDMGRGDLNDIEAAVHYLHSLSWVDPNRIGIFGISYGAFVALTAIARLPHLWKVAVEWFGPVNLLTFVKTVPRWWTPALMETIIGHPEKDHDLLVERSPLTYADQIQAPLLIFQGAKDPRVVKAEGEQMVERLRARQAQVAYELYEDEGHGFTRRDNRLKAYKRTADWLEQHLLGTPKAQL